MKYLLMLLLLVSCFNSDSDKIKDAESGMPVKSQNVEDDPNADANAQNGFVEENDQCICTKEYNPVCGSNGKMYPNPCQAGCEGVTEFTQGACGEAAPSEEAQNPEQANENPEATEAPEESSEEN